MPRTSGGAERILRADGRAVTALLGPTNTGKTHRAIQQMLSWPSGMIGLPLRLLAREVYDRVVAERGPRAVALVTGEEKILPPDPSYWVCTVEAMPVDRPVAFLAVDEVQLCADRARGHAFTDRVLHARGLAQTLLMGADTAAPLLHRLVPGLEVQSAERLSTLSHSGHHRLAALPPRTAVVAFSVHQVYALAERIRARFGGAAVVLGALSPRTRNSQVELYQSGQVQHMVATDAIGMGLNMDIDHVAFTAVRKFDGLGFRELHPAELAQIAGRAGRWRRDGTFGTTGDQEPLEEDVARAIEGHRFPPLRRAWWRNSDLDLSSVDELRESLARPPPQPELRPIRGAEDLDALEVLAASAEVRERATGEDRVRLLWDVCCVPDFRKTLTGSHHELLRRLYRHLVDGPLPDDWVASRIERLDRPHGDIDALTTRIAFIRTWNYVAYRPGWVRDAPAWQERTSEIEEHLSDALHEQLTLRFVERRVRIHLGAAESVEVDGDLVRVGGQPLGTLAGFRFRPDASTASMGQSTLRRVAARALAEALEPRVRDLEAAPQAELRPEGRLVRWRGAPIGRLEAGSDPSRPQVRALLDDLAPASVRRRVRERLEAWVRGRVEGLLAPLRRPPTRELSDAGAALVASLAAGLGTVPPGEVDRASLSERDRRALGRLGVRLGHRSVHAAALLTPGRMAVRGWLGAVWLGLDEVPPDPGARPCLADDGREPRWWWAVGYVPAGRWWVRADVAERLVGYRDSATRAGALLERDRVAAVEVLTALRR